MKILPVFAEAKKLYKAQLSSLFLISLIAALIWKIWRILAIPSFMIMANVSPRDAFILSSEATVRSLSIILAISFTYFIILISLSYIFSVLILKKGKFNHGLFLEGLNHILPVVFTSFLLSLILSFGMIFFILPFFILGFLLQFSVLAVILNGKRGISALIYSARFSFKNLKKVFVFSIFLWIPVVILHILTRKILPLSIFYHSLVIPFLVTCQYVFYRKLTAK